MGRRQNLLMKTLSVARTMLLLFPKNAKVRRMCKTAQEFVKLTKLKTQSVITKKMKLTGSVMAKVIGIVKKNLAGSALILNLQNLKTFLVVHFCCQTFHLAKINLPTK